MFDSLTMARKLTDAGMDRAQAEVLADCMRQAAEHRERLEPGMLQAEMAALLADFRADMYRAMLLQTGVTVGAIVALVQLLD